MQRGIGRRVASVALVLVSFVAAGCSQLPAGADGDLANAWPAMAEPVGWQPETGVCHATFLEYQFLSSYGPTACDKGHFYETIHVGEFPADLVSGEVPVNVTSRARRHAWADCDKRTTTFLGAQWRSARIWIGVSLPSTAAWEGGARWYRCEVAVAERDGKAMIQVGTVKDALKGASELKHGCFQYSGGNTKAISCKKPHNAEFVGVHLSKLKYSQLLKSKDQLAIECRKLVAKFVKVPYDGSIKYRSGVFWNWPSQQDWNAGDQGVRCHLWLDTKKVSRSLAGAGTSGLPINYG